MNSLRPSFAAAVLAVCLFSPLAPAQTTTTPAKPKLTPQQQQQQREHADMLRKYDKNRNGKLDPDEVKQMKKDRAAAKQFMNAR